MRNIKILFLSLITILIFSSCEEVDAIKAIIPNFTGKMPNIFQNTYAILDSSGSYTDAYSFDSSKLSFVHDDKTNNLVTSGTYSFKYEKFLPTECNGYLVLNILNERGELVGNEKLGFKWEASALLGPLSLNFENGETYYYQGEKELAN